ncbi:MULTISPECIES: ABC transporter ATP-binding protein [unclassified Treponema]|uniref:ABC transporter ATP-binding protein n=1 Tax=unclassified Treponema TaxID=2638727 RepID=UPI0020A5C845|nr:MULTISPECIES: ABC transporter ATP-binding protein [unclassified Treponema]UTC66843.1 ABC transporter ATP-binding protein [Treponema sp. OMZ 789]UTC69574.1 ABC transporter ATP-binding protein [Treponema sp. OMZ 790]UTC72288.1 ABC transporter ATP-binding protein [Treponema sp. OMZ 791]
MLKKYFALSDKGARDLNKAVVIATLGNLFLIVPMGLSFYALQELLKPLEGGSLAPLNPWVITGLCVLIVFVLFLIEKLKYRKTFNTCYEESANVRISLAESIRKLPLSYFGKKDLSDLTATLLNDVTTIEHALGHTGAELFGAIASIIISAAMLAFFDWRMTLALFTCAAFGFLFVYLSRKQARRYAVRMNGILFGIYNSIQQMLDNVKVLKSSDKKESYVQKVKDDIAYSTKEAVKAELFVGSVMIGSIIVIRFGFPLVIAAGAVLYAQKTLPLFTYLVFLLIAGRIFEPLTAVFMLLGEFFHARTAVERQLEIVNYPKQTGSETFNPNGYDIQYDNVSFSYNDDAERDTVSNIGFTAKQGEITALVGHSGCGKSTIARLAARFWDTSSGTVRIGGVDVSTVEPETLLTAFSIVFQDVVLFNDTVYNNILIGNKDATEEQVLAAAKAARCHDFIEKLPEGYDTVIGENGYTLSGGERQRLSIARALLKDAPVILLDEATAALDPENETLIQEALTKLVKNKTVIVIAHRLRTVEHADKIVVLKEGKIEEIGTHEQLMKGNSSYPVMYRLQKESESWSA